MQGAEIAPLTHCGRDWYVNHQQMVDQWLANWSQMHMYVCGQHRESVDQFVLSTDGLGREKGFATVGGRSGMAIPFTILSLTSVQLCADTP